VALRSFAPGLAVDKVTGKGVPVMTAKVLNLDTGDPVDVFDPEDTVNPRSLTTNQAGYFAAFKADADRLSLTFGGVTLFIEALELYDAIKGDAAAAASSAAAAQTAAENAAAGATAPTKTTVDTIMGGDTTNLVPAVNARRKKGSTITPDDFTGANDKAKLQACINYCVANGYPTIVFDRMLDITGQGSVSIDKVPSWTNRTVITLEGSGGGIVKNDAGIIFTSATANTGDITIRGLKFASTSGAGTVVIDGDKLIRLSLSENEYRSVDRVFSQTTVGRFAQTVRFHKEHVVAGTGPAITFRESYDVTVDDCLFEDRTAGVWNSDGTMTVIANRNLRITKSLFENMSGVPIKLAYSWGCVLDGNYFEFNGAATDPQIDLYSLAASARQRGVVLRANQVQQTTAQKAAKVGSILMGTTNPLAPLVSQANVMDSGIMWQFAAGTSGTVVGTGDYVENGGLVVFPGQEDRYLAPIGQTTVTTAGRPKSPVIGRDVYFDTTLGKPVWPKTAGTKGAVAIRFTAGATASGTITLTIFGVAYNVAVTAGDSTATVQNKVVAATGTFLPTWSPRVFGLFAMLDSSQRGLLSGAVTFSAGGTGVTQDFCGIYSPGTDPVWVDATGAAV